MKIVKPVFYKDFRCIAGDCPDSCCQGWEVDADIQSLEFYKTLNPELEIKKRIDSVLDKDEFGNTIFTLAPKKRCPFLNDENLCDMHIAIGAEHTPYTCRNFPRFFNTFGATREIGVSFSCPVAADMMYNLDRWDFEEEFNSDPPELNEIDAQTFYVLRKTRDEIIDVLRDGTLHIRERLLKMLEISYFLYEGVHITDEIPKSDGLNFFDVFRNPELINPEWEEKVNGGVIHPIENTKANENIAIYFIYKYFLTSVFEDNIAYGVETAVKMAVVGVLINTYFGSDAWTMHLWSKETEHSQYNMDRYKRLLLSAECLSFEQLIALVKKGVE